MNYAHNKVRRSKLRPDERPREGKTKKRNQADGSDKLGGTCGGSRRSAIDLAAHLPAEGAPYSDFEVKCPLGHELPAFRDSADT